ncbi:molecular chaperone (small heat shock protein) [Desulfosporosinus acidiphilus SJ4]|uniref:Molecular chaperone (Small heat shock protein) n=1 Tax=Desulfosporosinus acidiphilus (strain DSM 22704 / JCM 16185 / SJ4) TaxID=646529 RepID=I4D4I5_DESAJ|nr:Hsp20/alpha crystallin family protein [Desulfosporosinus acidiphilus]AFM40709.1 molecular chaperone (small heat shock protein) [Desulfosporosinus acidiphilus SJ4]
MALIPYEPFRLFDPLWHDMDRMLMRRGKEDVSEWLYRVDVDETPTKVIVTAEIPGIENKDDLNIQVDENVLTILGEVKRLQVDDDRSSRHSERYYGTFSRRITLPALVKTDGAHASYRNGVLELTFLKDQHPAARRIDVEFS